MSKQINIIPNTGEKQKTIHPPLDNNRIDPFYNSKLVFSFKDIADKTISHISCEHGKFLFEILKSLSQKTLNDVFENQNDFDYHILDLDNPRKENSKDLQHVREVVPNNKTKIHRIGLRNKKDSSYRRIIFDFDEEDNSNVLTIYHIAKQHYD